MQPSLFPLETTFPLLEIHGLCYIPNFITTAEEQALLQAIDAQPWLTDLKRRVQHYGWKYDYTARRVDEAMRLGPLPDWLMALCQRLQQECHFQNCLIR